MSVLINGMRFPQNCVHCELCHDEGFCIVTGTTINMWGQKRNAHCPLIELPDHGDLIDRGELMKHEVYIPRDGGNLPVVYMSYVKAAKTFIPAERSEE